MSPRYRLCSISGIALMAILLSTTVLSAQIGREYTFSTSSDTYTSITAGNEVISGTTTSTYGTFDESRTAGPFNIGFNFVFNCVTYTQFTVGVGGYMVLGTTSYGTTSNSLNASGVYPIIAPFWDQQHMYDGACSPPIDPDVGVYYQVTGTAPNRVLTVEWRTQFNSGGTYYWYNCTNGPLLRYKARLYEGTNRIEFQYGPMYQALALSASIGITAASNNFYSVSPGVPVTVSSTTANNAVTLTSVGIAQGTIYQFTPNKLVVDGRTGPGNEGVANLKEGDTLLGNVADLIGQTSSYTPIELKKACAAPPIPVQMSITGPDAGSYSFVATGNLNYNTSVIANSGTIPAIRFAPLHGGEHDATLNITNVLTSATVSYKLLGESAPRIRWIGNVASGGTPNVADGDTLINGTRVVFGTSMSWSPLTLENILKPGLAPPAHVTYTLNDPTGNYSLDMTSDDIDGEEQSTPTITFNAQNTVGYQEATLTVFADGETRRYLLRAFAAAPGGILRINGLRIDSTSQLFVNDVACVGEGLVTYEVTAENTGSGDFIVNGFSLFASDTVIGPGTPPYPMLRDAFGRPVPLRGYFIGTGAANSKPHAPGEPFEVIVPEGESRTFRLIMSPTYPGRHFGRIYFETNGFKLYDRTIEGVVTRGLVSAGLFGSGIGASLHGVGNIERPKGVVFEQTEVRETRMVTAWLYNNGECDLRINKDALRLESGDIDEFQLVEVLPNTRIDGDDYVLAPGTGDTVVIAFTPKSYGSRLATIRLLTNDSTLGGNGVIERGTYFWDVFGVGSLGLEGRDLRLAPAAIGGENSRGSVRLENTSAGPIEIESININGGNGEILPDPSNPWPTLPLVLQPGEQLDLWVVLQPDPAGTAGDRSAEMEIQIKGGNPTVVRISGYAGTRTLVVNPPALFTATQISVGEIARSFAAVTNTGTLPVRLTDPVLSGVNMNDYRVGSIIRRVLEPGQTEIFEVTYIPQAPGASTAQLSFGSNATNGPQIVQLGGEAGSTIRVDDPSESSRSQGQATPGAGLSRASVGAIAALDAPVPNPVSSTVTIRYRSMSDEPVRVGIFNEKGEMVMSVVEGRKEAGEFSEVVDLSGLSVGRYFIRLDVGGMVVTTESLNLIR